MRVGWQALTLVAAVVLTTAASAHGQYRPEVPVLKCAHEGEPVPGVPGATFDYLWPPGIDAAGNVLFSGYMTGPGITSANDEGLWFGQPGAAVLVARDGWAAPNLPGIVYSGVASVSEAVSETGWIVFTAFISGPGVTPDVNDRAVFGGPPGDFRLVKRTGDSVPELGPNIVVSGTESMGAIISDNGTIFVGAGLDGSGLPATYDRAYWVGPRDGMELAAWHGMPVQGCADCEFGVYLAGVGGFSFNDAGQVAFGGTLAGPGIGWYNSIARFIGPPGGLVMMHRTWQFVPQFGPGIRIVDMDNVHALNGYGDQFNRIRLWGTGVTTANDWALVGGEPEPSVIIAREGDPTPVAGEGTYIAGLGNPYINELHGVFFQAKFAGPSIDESNCYGNYLGPYSSPRLIQQSGQSADYFPPGTMLDVGFIAGSVAMNDIGDFAGVGRSVSGAGTKTEVLGSWRALTAHYIPLVETGSQVQGRTVTLSDYYSLYNMKTGGADGLPQSFNDRRQLATLLDFTDGTSGVYRIGPPLLGDTDGDGQVGAAELIAYAGCALGPGAPVAPGCEALNPNLDGTVDLADLALLQAMVGEQR
jgi:hypothetical protein